MDVITTAVTAGASEGGISAAYQMLKSRLAGNSPAVADAIADIEQDPGSQSRQFALSDALAAAGLAGDRYLRAAARNLIDEVEKRRQARVSTQQAGIGLTPGPTHAVMKVWFGTDRDLTGDRHPARLFGSTRGAMRYGACEVSIPREHRMGELESPSLLRLEFSENPVHHVVLLAAELADGPAYFDQLKDAVSAGGEKTALLFVHGYRVTFEDAARRTAQLAYDLGYQGVPVFYSWPSQGKLAGYIVDEANVEWALPNFTTFLRDVLEQSGAEHVYLLAHSMGNRALVRGVAKLMETQPELAKRIREIILTAPDIDADVFRQQIAPALASSSNPVTLYASSDDAALLVSKRVHGYPRAGESGSGLVVTQGVETIDATGVDTGFIQHSYYAERRSALSDMYYLIHQHARAGDRFGLAPVEGNAGRYWVFRE